MKKISFELYMCIYTEAKVYYGVFNVDNIILYAFLYTYWYFVFLPPSFAFISLPLSN